MNGYKVPPGPSIFELIWCKLDDLVDQLQDAKIEYGAVPVAAKHEAQGVAECLAILNNPYNPNIQEIRREAVRRWEARQK